MTFMLGLDLGGTNVKVALVTEGSLGVEIASTGSIPTPSTGGADAILRALAALAIEHIEDHKVTAIGVTFPGVIDVKTGISTVTPNLPGAWENLSVSGSLGNLVGRQVFVLNDARAFAFAESVAGAASGYSDVLAITLGTGIGGGVVIGGRIHGGKNGIAGEFGHQTVAPDGPLCGCGNRGCIEAVARPAAIAAEAGVATVEDAFRRAALGDDRAVQAVRRAVEYLAIGICNAHALLSPGVVVIGGGIAAAGDALLTPLRHAVAQRMHLTTAEDLPIVVGRFGTYAGAVGAALWARDAETRAAR